MNINQNYQKLQENYLFATIGQKVGAYQEANPNADIIRMGIGDVTLPLCQAAVTALHEAADEMGKQETFRGYGPYEGYVFLREALRDYYASFGVKVGLDEIFVGEGAKSDVANILDIFSEDNKVLIPDPVYPVYLDTNVMVGRTVQYMDANASNGFLPLPDPTVKADLIYLCSPNNPTGAVYTHDMLKTWVDYANSLGAVILFDAAYESFIRDESLPRSIFAVPGAETCAIEFCSLSKIAGFTGTRCGYTVIPRALKAGGVSLADMWMRRQSTKYNGVSYVVQKAAAAVFTPQGLSQVRQSIGYYMDNATYMADTLRKKNVWFTGGDNSPYLWMRCPNGMDSWSFFDLLLEQARVVGTPGAGFGKNGEGYFRLTAFGGREATVEAMNRLGAVL